MSDRSQKVYLSQGEGNSTISKDEKGRIEGKVVALDHILDGEKVTFIKMDIEGAEQSALRGAEQIIRAQRPALAICLYHKVEDMLEIPVWIKKLVPEYKIYIRHYSNEVYDTVCYAVIN